MCVIKVGTHPLCKWRFLNSLHYNILQLGKVFLLWPAILLLPTVFEILSVFLSPFIYSAIHNIMQVDCKEGGRERERGCVYYKWFHYQGWLNTDKNTHQAVPPAGSPEGNSHKCPSSQSKDKIVKLPKHLGKLFSAKVLTSESAARGENLHFSSWNCLLFSTFKNIHVFWRSICFVGERLLYLICFQTVQKDSSQSLHTSLKSAVYNTHLLSNDQ